MRPLFIWCHLVSLNEVTPLRLIGLSEEKRSDTNCMVLLGVSRLIKSFFSASSLSLSLFKEKWCHFVWMPQLTPNAPTPLGVTSPPRSGDRSDRSDRVGTPAHPPCTPRAYPYALCTPEPGAVAGLQCPKCPTLSHLLSRLGGG